jgi:hypothetical protein
MSAVTPSDTDTIQTLAQSRVAGQQQDGNLNQSAMTVEDAEVLTEEEFEARRGEALADVLALFGVTSEDFNKARESGAQSVSVDTMRVVSRFEGAERETVLDAVRETPDGMTGAEAKAFDPAKRVEEAAIQMRAERERNVSTAEETKRLRNE